MHCLDAACVFVIGEPKVSAWESVQRAFWTLGKDAVSEVIQENLVPWALGYGDPALG